MEIPSEMQHQVMGYDRAANMFSPDGHLLQVEYAEKTVRLGSASIGVVCKDGLVIVADKRIRDKLLVQDSSSKIFEVDAHVIGSAAGMLSDIRILVDYAQVLAQQNRITYGSAVEPIIIMKAIADRKQIYTQHGGARPYAVAMMLGGITKGKVNLFTSDVTGNFSEYKANAIGENDEKIREILRKDYKEGLSVEDGIKFCLRVFKDTLGKNFEIGRFEVVYVKTPEEKLVRLPLDSLKKFVK